MESSRFLPMSILYTQIITLLIKILAVKSQSKATLNWVGKNISRKWTFAWSQEFSFFTQCHLVLVLLWQRKLQYLWCGLLLSDRTTQRINRNNAHTRMFHKITAITWFQFFFFSFFLKLSSKISKERRKLVSRNLYVLVRNRSEVCRLAFSDTYKMFNAVLHLITVTVV